MINTLYISYDGMTDPLGQSQVIPYLEGLSASGYSIHLISFEKAENDQRTDHIDKVLKEIGITWHPLTYTKRPPILSTFWDLMRVKKLVKKLHRDKRFQLIHCRSYIAALVGLDMKRKYGMNFIFDMRGFWADERVDGMLWDLNNPLYKAIFNYFKRKEKAFIKESSHIVSLTNNGKNVIEDWHLSQTPITVIPCCVDLALFKPQSENRVAQNPLTLGYLGAIGTWYMLPEMMDFFKTLLQTYPDAVFEFITRENPETILKEAALKAIPDSHIKIMSANREEIPSLIQRWNLSIFFIKPVFSKRASSPTKQGEIMAMGIPIICNSGVGDTDYVVEKFNSGVIVDAFGSTSFQKVVNQIDQLLKLDHLVIRNGAERYYSLENGILLYKEIYDALC